MKTWGFGALSVSMLGLFASPAAAQIAEGRSGTSTMQYISGRMAVEELWSFGRCVARSEAKQSFTLLATPPGTTAELQAFKKMFGQGYHSCTNGVDFGRVLPTLVRGTIAEGLYRNGTPVPASLVQQPPEPGVPPKSLSESARCFVAGHRTAAHALISQTRPASPQEQRMMEDLSSAIGACLPAKAGDRIGSVLLRYRIAEALLRMPAPVGATAPAR